MLLNAVSSLTGADHNVYFKRKWDFKAAIDQFFTVTLREIAGTLASRISDDF